MTNNIQFHLSCRSTRYLLHSKSSQIARRCLVPRHDKVLQNLASVVLITPKSFNDFLLQHFSIVGVGDVHQCQRTLMQIFAVQISNTIFCYDVVHMRPCGNHSRTRLQRGHNLRFALFGCRCKRNNGFAFVR